ncbi:MlaD family protein [Conexibacter sp. SYSU D00693]|uniref:MlaD family protein n=1 Tax=Conexibacter sp. SYSU D00693 TaxID=2812560 RepID=UPI00196A7351|nr:MlaD family protein [Conexibacter sp. SYSU D00693]
MNPRHRGGLGLVPAGLLTIALALVVAYFAVTKEVPFRGHHEVRAVFQQAPSVKQGTVVRVAGVTVGEVTDVEAVAPGEDATRVTMRVDDKALPIHRDATVKVRPRIFLEGNVFLDVSPGSPSAPELEDGATIGIGQTSAPVQVDQVLQTLQADTRKSLQQLLDELGRGLEGDGARGINGAIGHMEGAYRDGAVVSTAALGTERGDVRGWLRGAARTAEGLDRDPAALQALVTDLRAAAGAFAREDVALGRAVAELPRTLRAGQPALASLNRSFGPLRRLVADLRPAVRSNGPALDATAPFARQLRGLASKAELRGLAADLRPLVPDLARLNIDTRPLYEQVRAASSCQNEVVLPWTQDTVPDPVIKAQGKVYEEATKFLPGISGESRSGDANGQWFRVLISSTYASVLGADRLLLTGNPVLGFNPPKPAARPTYRPDVPCETQERPDLRTVPDPAPASRRVELSPDAVQPYLRLVQRQVRELNRQIKDLGLGRRLKAITEPATRETLAKVRAATQRALRAGR